MNHEWYEVWEWQTYYSKDNKIMKKLRIASKCFIGFGLKGFLICTLRVLLESVCKLHYINYLQRILIKLSTY
jgi:hypothetical protein